MARGQYSDACPKLAESMRLSPQQGTLMNLAACHELEGKTASAWAEFSDAAAWAGRMHRPDREQASQEQANALEARLSHVVLRPPSRPPAGLAVTLDGAALHQSVLGTALPLDPGEHQLVVTAPDHKPETLMITVLPGPSSQDVSIPRLETQAVLPQGASPPPTVHVVPQPIVATPSTRAPSSTRKVLGFAAVGLGAIGVGIGGYFGLRTFQLKNEGAPQCAGDACRTQSGADLENRAYSMSIASTIAFSAGFLAAAAGLYLVLSAPSSGPHPVGLAVSPFVAPGQGGVRLRGRW